ncbi:hypothetical protein GCM10027271_23770 [Saccharopolyspora gloriosae]|uniref:Uncharacterized protein n=1 Tax=Saccharopolyspora gloriosae TaxID=455344 RepID=A0A840NLZ5_9PSEU|nr:hypothetical protein [Saccharopolyspora gloriosae]MBB5071045.1 hypothetical protein [Saccharopolyspora gloriosae]
MGERDFSKRSEPHGAHPRRDDRVEEGHPLDEFVNDPTGMPPLCDEEQFVEIMAGVVADSAPRLFAVVQEYGCRVDGRVAAWGMALPDRVEVVSVERGVRRSAATAEKSIVDFCFGAHIRPRLVWVDPAKATPEDGETGTEMSGPRPDGT